MFMNEKVQWKADHLANSMQGVPIFVNMDNLRLGRGRDYRDGEVKKVPVS